MKNAASRTRPIAFALVIGLLGGAALIATVAVSKRGPMVFIPYAAMLVAVVAYFRARAIAGFMQRFQASLIAFMLSNLIGFGYVSLVLHPRANPASLRPTLWSLAAMVLIGIVVSAAVAAATPARSAAR
jgi:hypothetical protein